VIKVVDDLGRQLRFDRVPRRIVSLVPSLTETICAFGRRSVLVGVTRHCCEPAAELESIARIGGTKNPDLDGIAKTVPELVIANVEENRREDAEELERRDIKVFATYPRRVAALPSLLRRLGLILDATPAADSAAAALEGAIREARARRRAASLGVFCPIWKNPWMTFNGDTFAADLLELLGARNVFHSRQARYFEVSLEEVAAEKPAAILLPDEPYVFSAKDLPSLQPLADTPALRMNRIHFVDGKLLFWFGTRTASALTSLLQIIGDGR
jgi:ABC-type Fe3+-hydroxamate transport system substrate-binding protein